MPFVAGLSLLLCSAVSGQDKLPDLGLFGNPDGLNLDELDATVEFSATVTGVETGQPTINVTATIPDGYYMYSMDPSFGGATTITLNADAGVRLGGDWTADHEPKSVDDELLGQTVEKFFDTVTWSAPLAGNVSPGMEIKGSVSGQYCGSGENGVPGECRQISDVPFVAIVPGTPEPSTTTAEPAIPSSVTLEPEIGFGRSAKKGLMKFDVSLEPSAPATGAEVTLAIKATIQDPWHTFALDQNPEMAGQPTTIELASMAGLTPIGDSFTPSAAPEEKQIDVYLQRVHHHEVTWSRRFVVTGPVASVTGAIRFQMCRNGTCLPPTTTEFTVGVRSGASTAPAPRDPTSVTPARSGSIAPRRRDDGLVAFIITAFGAGFVALLTPCVFPMIPVTVAFFLKQEEKKAGSSLGLAVVYCLSIIGAFTVLGLATAVIFGSTALNDAANNRWLNVAFAFLFFLFALILLGAINIQIPSWLLTWTSKKESSGGFVGVVFMALTFTLISFTCTFAFVGGLLVLATQGTYLRPIIGMLAFSTAFASPFFLLALFPSMLRKLPRSGGWMDDVKFAMGIVELALVLKFLSVADIGFSPTYSPRYLSYDSFLIGWIVLAAIVGVYLVWRLLKSSGPRSVAVKTGRTLAAVTFLGFAGLLVLGLQGRLSAFNPVWKHVAAFAPPQLHLELDPDRGVVALHNDIRYALQFDKAVQAGSNGRLLFVDFTGQNCVNCRLMERTVLSNPEVLGKLKELDCFSLYADLVPGFVDPSESKRLQQRNVELQKTLTNDVTLPTYAILTPDGKLLSVYFGLDTTGGAEFLSFIAEGREKWEQLKSGADAVVSSQTTDRPTGESL